jgi:hypothetical protein
MIPLSQQSHPVLIIIKLFVSGSFFLYAYLVNKKSKSTLNKFFVGSFISWALYNFFDVITMFLAPLGILWFVIANITWRIQILLIMSYTFFVYNSSAIIKFGKDAFANKKRLYFQIALLLLSFIFISIFTRITIQTIDNIGNNIIPPEDLPPNAETEFTVNEEFDLHASIFAVPFVFFIIGAVRLALVAKEVESPRMKRNIILNLLGNILIPIGLIYFLLRSFFWEPTLLNSIFGQGFFLLSPILIYRSQSKKE